MRSRKNNDRFRQITKDDKSNSSDYKNLKYYELPFKVFIRKLFNEAKIILFYGLIFISIIIGMFFIIDIVGV
jgi:hypothetical protein